MEALKMENKHVKTLSQATLKQSAAKGGCGECQTSCQLFQVHFVNAKYVKKPGKKAEDMND